MGDVDSDGDGECEGDTLSETVTEGDDDAVRERVGVEDAV